MTKTTPSILFSGFCLWLGLMVCPAVAHATKTIAIIYNNQNNTYSFAATQMKKVLEGKGYLVTLSDIEHLEEVSAKNRIILTVRGNVETERLLSKAVVSKLPASAAQGYAVRLQTYVGYKDWYVIGNDKVGTLYGGLDVCETIKLKGIDSLFESDKAPFIANRGIKFNIPLDARTPSYSDNADAARQNIANMWEESFWHEMLDQMALNRFNVLSLWSLSPFPSLTNVPEYPNAGLHDVKINGGQIFPTTDAWYMSTKASLSSLVTIKKITLDEKIQFWQNIMQYASDRGIDCYLFTWNLFVYGTEESGYGFTDKITDDKTKDYIRKATKALLKHYPLLKGIGITAGENMYRLAEKDKEKFLFESYGQGINDALANEPGRKFNLIHRAHQADITLIKNAFALLDPSCTMSFSYKYSVAQMYSAVAPKYIYESKFLEQIGDSKFFLTVRDDAWYNLRGGSDPAFARAYFLNMPQKNFEGFYVGPDGYTWGREYLSKTPDTPRKLVTKKRWYCMQMLGKLAYDPSLPDSYFTALLADRFPEVNAKKLQQAWAKGSQVMPWVNMFHNERSQNDFQWYPEAGTSFYGFRSIQNFIATGPQKGEGLMSIPQYTEAVLTKKTMTGISPLQVAANLQKTSNDALSLVSGMINLKDKELRETIGDIKAMAYLGLYYANKISGATHKDISDKTNKPLAKAQHNNQALQSLKGASVHWRKYAAQLSSMYQPQHLTRMHFTVDFKAMQAHVDKEVSMLNIKLPQAMLNTQPPLQQLEVVFSNYSTYYFWHLDKLSLPADWSGHKYVVLEVFATSSQPFDVILQTNSDTLVKRAVKPAANSWMRMVIPINDFKLSTANSAVVAAYRNIGNPAVATSEMLGIGVSISKPVGYPVLEIRSIKLSNEESESTTAYTPATSIKSAF